jgi:hypothetical protein
MRARLHLPRGERFYSDALEGLVRVNETLYRENPSLPSIYDAGVRYRGSDPGEDWRNVTEVTSSKYGDCEDLAAARAAELRVRRGENARAEVKRTGPHMTHAFVIRGDGSIEDPSRKLGMTPRGREQLGGIAMAHDYTGYDRDDLGAMLYPTKRVVKKLRPTRRIRVVAKPLAATKDTPHPLPGAPADDPRPDPFPRERDYPSDVDFRTSDSGVDEEGDFEASSEWATTEEDYEQLGADPAPSNELSFVINRIPSGFQGVVKVPFIDGRAVTVARAAPTKKAAAASALSTASNLLDSPLAKALIPPQAQAMLNVIRSPTAQKAAAVALNAAKKLKFW